MRSVAIVFAAMFAACLPARAAEAVALGDFLAVCNVDDTRCLNFLSDNLRILRDAGASCIPDSVTTEDAASAIFTDMRRLAKEDSARLAQDEYTTESDAATALYPCGKP